MARILQTIGMAAVVILALTLLAVAPALVPGMRLPDGRKASDFGVGPAPEGRR